MSFIRITQNGPVSHLKQVLSIILVIVGLGLPVGKAPAQTVLATETQVVVEMLESRIQAVDASGDLDETNKALLLDLYRKSISLIEQRAVFDAAVIGYSRAQKSAPAESADSRRQLDRLQTKTPKTLSNKRKRQSLPELQQQLLSEKADLTRLRTDLEELQAMLTTQQQRPQLVRERLNNAKRKQVEVSAALLSPHTQTDSPRLDEARRWAFELEAKTLSAEIKKLNEELLSQPTRIELLSAKLDLAALKMTRQTTYSNLLEALVSVTRLSEAESVKEEAEETERQAFGKHELLQEMAQRNTELSEELNSLAGELEKIIGEESTAASQAERIADNFRLARQKLEIAGLNEAFGQLLLKQRRGLPEARDFKRAAKRRKGMVIESSLRQIANQQESAQMRDIELYVDDLLAPQSPTWRQLLRDEVMALADTRRGLIDKAIAADDAYLQTLGELDFAQQLLAETVAGYNAFLDERLLWIRTGEPPSWQMLASIKQNIGVFLSVSNWIELARALFFPSSFPWVLLIGVMLFAGLLKLNGRLHTSLKHSGLQVGQLRHDRFSRSLRALMLTLVLALPWPILFKVLGLHFQSVQSIDAIDIETHIYGTGVWSGAFVPAIGAGFQQIALHAFYFIAFFIFCEKGGLAAAHFGWSDATTALLRQETKRLMFIFLPAVFWLAASISYDPAALAGGLSRLFFVLVMLSVAWFFMRVLSPHRGAVRDFYLANPGNPITWFRYLWLTLGLALPIALAPLATIGYVYTAAELGTRLVDTIWLIVAIILVHHLVVRWMLLTQRQLEFNDTLERHRAQRAAKISAEGDDNAAEIELPEPVVDFRALSDDSTSLINTALVLFAAAIFWLIWTDVFPALSILDQVALWQYSGHVNGGEELVPVTLKDVIFGLLAILIIIASARRLPALLEIALLTRLNITAGSRYTIATLTQYSIVAIGVVFVFDLLGGSWSEIQWLIAALGVGIGFGLQEIVANFISGLILLFERPIRIGDVVTVGDTDGVVTKIRIRSTTIRNWDQKELLVPNKEFITGRLLNWTLSDSVTRIVIPVGIAYGSDVTRAIALMQKAADDHERVLDDPPSLVSFESFGDSSLTIVLRCFTGSVEHWRKTSSELHLMINDHFNEAGIVMAFPQRDVHLDISQPLDLRIHKMPPVNPSSD